MEFEPSENTHSSVSEEERLLAQARKKTLQPMNPFLAHEDLPDPVVVDEPQPNLTRDKENTAERASLIQPSASSIGSDTESSKGFSLKKVIVTIAIIGLTAIIVALALNLPKTQ